MSLAAVLPIRTRLSLTGASLAAHLAALSAFALVQTSPTVLAPLNIDVIPQGDYVVDTIAIASDSAPEPAPEQAEPEAAQAAPATPAPVAPAEMEPDPAAQQAELAAREKQSREKKRREAIEARREAAREEAREEARQERLREKRRAAQARHNAMRRASAQGGGSQAHRAGVADGAAARAARASYGAIISAELNRHKSYPPSARARGESGAVGVAFTVGGSGRIVGHSIVSSSGSSAIDGAVHAMMRAAHAPPPPGGAFHGSIVVRFNLSR
ncbi:protein TonB [Rhodoblastus acidophilus]|uniref:TonB family protein n=1 Tax=Rhodoblastus acidophilus TaxID=1074 RepID=UPI0022243B59|nr:TonB family protein [Rhodoblastus acidophilus]MCW2285808.1 protein TonB [Rhodoblastus acidophilus]MCW2333369.1 protein TonB [Rhodoblastus acidophilus]